MAPKRRARLSILALAVLACGAREGTLRPLADGDHHPDVLVESDRPSLRPTLGGNRFAAGWWPRRREGLTLTALDGGARLEIVHLAERPRILALDLASDASGGRVEVRAAGRALGAVALADPLEIALPADLPRGRVLVELAPRGAALAVREARVRPALPAGAARWVDGDLVQSGDSRLDFVRRVAPGDSLVGRFTPPSPAHPGQRFRLRVELQDGSSSTVFEWTAGLLDRLRGSRRFEAPLGGGGAFARVSLEAHGAGPPGRWSSLALAAPPRKAKTPVPRPARFEPPALVLVYVMDALRADSLAHLGGLPGVSPTLDRLAREGFTFRAHASLAPNTLPSTKALFTGEAYVDRGGWKLPGDGASTLAQTWRRAGYRTGLFSGNAWVSPAYGMDRGFEHVKQVPLDERRSPYNDNAERLHEAALAWLNSLPRGEPAFLYVHTIHPHNPYDPPEPWRSELTRGIASTIDGSTRTLLALGKRRIEAGAADRERLRRLYAASLAYNDAQLGLFLAELERLFRRRRLFVAVTSDHGEELFDHGGVLHGYTLYDEMIRIPLVAWSPGLVRPGESRRLTSTLDLHATLLELAGHPAAGEGRSLLPLLSGSGEPPRAAVQLAAAASVKGGIYAARSERWKLIWAPRTGVDWGLGGGPGRTRSQEYLFDLEGDPAELINRAGEGGLEAAWLRSRLAAWIEAKKASGDAGGDAEVDDETRRRLEALGYVQ